MKDNYLLCGLYIFVVIILSAGCISSGAVTPFYRYATSKKILNEPPYLQILLSEYNNVDFAMIKINSDCDIYPYAQNRYNKFIIPQQLSRQNSTSEPIRISYNNDEINISNKTTIRNDDIVIIPAGNNSLIQVGQRSYRGYLRIKGLPGNKISLVNIIDLESYLPGVVSSEMDESWPESSLAAQAITARSFALFRIKNLLSRPPPAAPFNYDLTDDIYSQVYRGEERTGPKTRQAVEKTRGIIISYNSLIFNTLFHSTCGGSTEPGDLIFGLTPLPPLKGRKCGFCYHSKYSQWQAEFTQDEIIKALNLKDVSKIEDIEITKTAPGGHAIEVALRIEGRDSPIIFQAQKFRIALNPNKLRSTMFQVTKKNGSFEFNGHGWGHAVGMCQEGTRGMAQQNFTPLQILEYYYQE
ncbi:MAG: SpoIID/LytB domain-containing protein, partial [Planctomycetota bacterium]